MSIRYVFSPLSFQEVLSFLQETDTMFPTPLSERVDLEMYAKKLSGHSNFSLSYAGNQMVGMISCYTNRPPMGYISNICVKESYQGKGVFKEMFRRLVDEIKKKGIDRVRLEVDDDNVRAMDVYTRLGFSVVEEQSNVGKKLMEYVIE